MVRDMLMKFLPDDEISGADVGVTRYEQENGYALSIVSFCGR